LRREAAEIRVEAAYAGNNLRRGELAAEIRHRFHEALFKQETVRATETWTFNASPVSNASSTSWPGLVKPRAMTGAAWPASGRRRKRG
jgi:hypothetical protein